MYVLYVDSQNELGQKTQIIRQHLEPLLAKLVDLVANERIPDNVPELKD